MPVAIVLGLLLRNTLPLPASLGPGLKFATTSILRLGIVLTVLNITLNVIFIRGLGPIPAVQQLLTKTGLSLANIDVIESNEAFAAQALAVSQTLGLDPLKVNPNGGAIALGHPVGATGAILLVKTLYELERINGQFGLVTLCIGGGQGIALLVERCG